jgi:hypothetical protein
MGLVSLWQVSVTREMVSLLKIRSTTFAFGRQGGIVEASDRKPEVEMQFAVRNQ